MVAFQVRLRMGMLALAVLVTSPIFAIKEKKAVKKVEKKSKKREELSSEQLMCEVYSGLSGFGIPQAEESLIIECGGAPTYGEILWGSLKEVLDNVPAELKEGKFVDLGSGIGKTCFQAYVDYPFSEVIGVELSKKRFDASMDVYEVLKEQGHLVKGRQLKFINEDFTRTKLKGATVIYMCSTCYSNELMDTIAEKISKLTPGMQVITLKAFPNPEKYGLELIKEYKLPMTWSKDTGGSPVHVYELKGKPKKEKKMKKEGKKGKKGKKAVGDKH